MDSITLNLPVSTLGNAAPGATDAMSAETIEGAVTADFATLLATGLEIAQTGLQPAPVLDRSAAPTTESAVEKAATDVVTDTLAALPGNFMPAAPVAHTTTPAAAESIEANPQVEHDPVQGARQATPVAADAARIAASASKEVADAATSTVSVQDTKRIADDLVSAREITQRQAQTSDAPRPTAFADVAAAHLHAMVATDRPNATQHATALLNVSAPVSGPGFADALSRQVVWMVDKDAQVAELRINPPELGPVEVRLTLSGEDASAQFVSAHAEVRNAIEASLSRLREAMAEAGIQLGDATVSAESFRDQAAARQDQRESRSGYGSESQAGHGMHAGTTERARTGVARGLIDVFA